MRRVAAELGTGPMSLYRYVTNKDELVAEMADQIFGECALPVPGPAGWRAKLELIARAQWALCRRHHWLPGAVSFTRPSLTPRMMAHTEWTLRALDGLGLSLPTKMHEALALHSLVLSVALSAADVEAEQETGVTPGPRQSWPGTRQWAMRRCVRPPRGVRRTGFGSVKGPFTDSESVKGPFTDPKPVRRTPRGGRTHLRIAHCRVPDQLCRHPGL
ncbi:TetR/AcrR family transcriptional regulator [Amycolatopsis panacis]|uniref:TetR/AcrR family transcriptional regulator n=1 Tax=Amycolatopsis panacis TaxID=2340917 RepID=UPI001F38EA25|nr:TetR/AcrR family transcriptional regulator [Amycolatopsis panacis]